MKTYPNAPGFKRAGTSEAAALKMNTQSERMRDDCFIELAAEPQTADEVAAKLFMDILSIRPRISELARRGRIFDTGARRINSRGNSQIVWTTKPK